MSELTVGSTTTIQHLFPKPDLLKARHILCVQPHPDDNEIGAGGSIKVFSDLGIRISYCTVSQGRGGSNQQNSSELIRRRQQELRAAGGSIGASAFYQLDLKSTHYPDEFEITRQMVDVLRQAKPDVVMTVDPYLMYEAHPTHRKTGMAVLEACLFAPLKHFPVPDAEPAPEVHSVESIAFYASARPNTYIDISRTFDAKIRAILMHQSQFKSDASHPLFQYLDFHSRQCGRQMGVERAEGFKVLPVLLTHMMVEAESYSCL
jgi:N,N'-diacetylchitobiose non-reducing end deacetylase